MAFDPCGTRKLEGEDILKRLADHLGVDKDDLKAGLLALTNELRMHRERKVK